MNRDEAMETNVSFALNGEQLDSSKDDWMSDNELQENPEQFKSHRIRTKARAEAIEAANIARRLNFSIEPMTPILKSARPTIDASMTFEDADDSIDCSFDIKRPTDLKFTSFESLTPEAFTPEPKYAASCRLRLMEKHSIRSTSTPYRGPTSNDKDLRNLLEAFDNIEKDPESVRFNAGSNIDFVTDADKSGMTEEIVEGETSSTGLSWKEGMSNLIGDMSAPFRLPLHSSKHQDLKAISADTMANLLEGKFDKTLERFLVVDCRYPYEYEGGHISGAINIFDQDSLQEKFFSSPNPQDGVDHLVVIFHCEFSSERGPKLMRFMRNHDRDANQYPTLSYPEIYLLEGGYSAFFRQHPTLCQPQGYVPMLHPDYQEQLRLMSSKRRGIQEERAKNKMMCLQNFCSPNM